MRLLNRQLRLVEYLTSGGAIFRDRREAALDPALRGMARDRLDLEARFSHQKRMEKIVAVFPRTIAFLGGEYAAIERDFVEACPPYDISRIANARQFHDFLAARWKLIPAWPPHLPDVAACELACAEARIAADDPDATAPSAGKIGLRRRRDVVLLRCAFDIRAVFENDGAVPAARDICIAVALDPRSAEPRMLELAPELFDLLAALDGWTDASAFEASPEAAGLIAELTEAGLVETRH
jgi:hypothetical protein